MDKQTVIKIRDALKAGKNLPLLILVDNAFRSIDESKQMQFVKWDDTNGILYNYALTNAIHDRATNNEEATLSVYATDYEQIQALEVTRLPQDLISESIDSINQAGANVSAESKSNIIKMFKEALNPNPQNIDNDPNGYYTGRYKEPFKETRLMAARNEYAKKVAEENESKP